MTLWHGIRRSQVFVIPKWTPSGMLNAWQAYDGSWRLVAQSRPSELYSRAQDARAAGMRALERLQTV